MEINNIYNIDCNKGMNKMFKEYQDAEDGNHIVSFFNDTFFYSINCFLSADYIAHRLLPSYLHHSSDRIYMDSYSPDFYNIFRRSYNHIVHKKLQNHQQ